MKTVYANEIKELIMNDPINVYAVGVIFLLLAVSCLMKSLFGDW